MSPAPNPRLFPNARPIRSAIPVRAFAQRVVRNSAAAVGILRLLGRVRARKELTDRVWGVPYG